MCSASEQQRLEETQKVGGECEKNIILATYDLGKIYHLLSVSIKLFILVNFWTGSMIFYCHWNYNMK